MKINVLDRERNIKTNTHEDITLTPRAFYNQCKDYYTLLGIVINDLPKEDTISKTSITIDSYAHKIPHERIDMWVYSMDDNGSDDVLFSMPLDIVLGTKTPKECAIMELENDASDAKEELANMESRITAVKSYITEKEGQIEKIKNT